MTLRTEALSALRWTFGARLLAQVLTWAITLVIIRLLTPADYGLLAMATVFVALLSMLSEFGLGPAMIQQVDIDEGSLRSIFGIVLLVNVGMAALLVVSAPLIAKFFEEQRLVAIIQVLSLSFLINAFGVIPDALLQRRMKFRARALSDLAATVTASLLILALAAGGFGVWALVVGSLTTNLLKTVATNIWAPYWKRPSLSLHGMRSLLVFGGRMTLVQFLWFFFNQVDVLIVGRWLGKEVLGLYSVSMHFASMPNQRLSALINQVAFPTFARLQHDIRGLGQVLLNAVSTLGFVSFPLFWGISSIAPEIVQLVFGAKWEGAVMPIRLLALVMPLRLINTAVSNALQGVGRSDCVLRNTLWACVLTPPALLIGVHWGLEGVVFAWLAISPFVFVQNMTRSLPAAGADHGPFWKALTLNAGTASVMYLAVTGAREVLYPMWPAWSRVMLLIIVGVLTYSVAGWLVNRRTARGTIRLAKDVLRPARISQSGMLGANRATPR